MHHDLVLYNGIFHRLAENAPTAHAVWIRDGWIEAIGSNSHIHRLSPMAVDSLDLNGQAAFPGFVDGHTHFGMYAQQKRGVDFTGTTSLMEARRCISAKAGVISGWLTGHGWDANMWPGAALPDKTGLDDLLPDTPAAFWSKDVHMLWVNSAALNLAGITGATPDPKGGKIERDIHGEPTGILRENAVEMVNSVIPAPDPESLAKMMLEATADAHRLGITGIHCHGDSNDLQAYQILKDRGQLRLRTIMTIPFVSLDEAISLGVRTGFGDEWLRLGPVKVFADGALGSRTAAMLEPYNNDPENRGMVTLSPEEMETTVRRAAEAGISAAVHAIGDQANRTTIAVLSRHRVTPDGKELRQRIEHVQLLHPRDLPRFSESGITASMQPIHCTADIEIADRYWGKRSRYAYTFRSLLDSGARLVFGSDSPVETMDPLAGIYAAVTRQRPNGEPKGGWYPEERISTIEAVRAYTTGAACAAGEEQTKGTIGPGKTADITVLSCDILDNAVSIPDARVTHTIIGGEIVYLVEE